MVRLKIIEEYRAEDIEEAENFIATERAEGKTKGYTVIKASYTHKTKKAKGEIIDECELVSLTKEYNNIWLN